MWESMYLSGLEKEIYELPLSKAYYGLAFGEIVIDILHRTEGEVLLIGVVEQLADAGINIFLQISCLHGGWRLDNFNF